MNEFDLSPSACRRALAPVADVAPLDDAAVVERYARIVWNLLTEPGDGVAGRLLAETGSAEALRRLIANALAPSDVLTRRDLAEGTKRWRPRLAQTAVAHALEVAAVRGVRHLAPGDPGWPEQLADLGDNAPLSLWVRGDPAALGLLVPSVALVGARAATSYGDHVAVELAADLAGGGIPVVSGAAYGIDGAAHRAALAVGGVTVALLAGGVDRPYPAGHGDLIDRIARAGAVVSEVPCGSAPTKWRFLARNRLIAALSSATVVVEAGWRSGSLNTAGHAAALGRPIGAVPGPVTSAASAGCHRLLREFGAECVTSADDVRDLLSLGDGVRARARGEGLPDGRPQTDDRSRVRDALSVRASRDVDDLARRSGMSPADVEGHLGMMLLDAEATRDGRGWRRVSVTR